MSFDTLLRIERFKHYTAKPREEKNLYHITQEYWQFYLGKSTQMKLTIYSALK